jgi:hypothetical protein
MIHTDRGVEYRGNVFNYVSVLSGEDQQKQWVMFRFATHFNPLFCSLKTAL